MLLVSRLGKTLVVLSRDECDPSFFHQYFVERNVFSSLFSLAFSAPSSTLRLAATRTLCLFITTTKPTDLTAILCKIGYLNHSNPGDQETGSEFLEAIIRSLGRLLKPVSTMIAIDAQQASEPTLQVPCFVRSILIHQLQNMLEAITSSSQAPWAQLLRKTISEIIPKACTVLQAIKAEEQSNASFDWVVGLLSINASNFFPGFNFSLGSRAMHKGMGSSLEEDFTIVGYATDPNVAFGDQVYVMPTRHFDSRTASEIASSSDNPPEAVFPTFIQSRLVQSKATHLFDLFASAKDQVYSSASSHQDEELSSRQRELLTLLTLALTTETLDTRPASPFPKAIDGSETRALIREQRESVFESVHPYRDNTEETFEISIPGAQELTIIFDAQSRTEQNYDFLRFYKDASKSSYWGAEKYSGSTWPGINGVEPLKIPSDSFFLHFHTDGSNTDWGWKFHVSGIGSSTHTPP
jgi:hypothetical protein